MSLSEAEVQINVIVRNQEFQNRSKPLKESSVLSQGRLSPPNSLLVVHVALATFCLPSFLTFLPMAAPEQPVNLGARSDMLEQVRCPQSG